MKRTEAILSAPPLKLWPTVDISNLAEIEQDIFHNKYKAISLYFNGEKLNQICKITGIGITRISEYVSRCLKPHPDGRIYGFRALIAYKRIESYKRIYQPKLQKMESLGGMSGLLSLTLKKFPDVETKIRALILKKSHSDIGIHEKCIRPKDIHKRFLKLLETAGVSKEEWPFNTKNLGKRSVDKYIKTILDDSFGLAVKNREEKDARAHFVVGTGKQSLISFNRPFEAIEIDGYSINAFFSADFETPEGTTTQIALERIWLIAAICKVSEAIISYVIVYRSQVSADDVIEVIRKAANGQHAIELSIDELAYAENGGMPADVFPECTNIGWGSLFLDGALAHLADAVHNRARKAVGFTINWGPVGHFERRPNVERFFSSVSTEIFMRLPSTTGSNPRKGRADDAQDKAVRYKIRAEAVEEAFAVFVADYNGTPSSGLSYNSPLEVISHYIHDEAKHNFLRRLPEKLPGTLFIPLKKVCMVRGGRSNGRRPYIQFEGARYTSDIMSHAGGLIGKSLTLEFDERDIRFCNAYLADGAELGKLKVIGRWGNTKHSLRTRKIINGLILKRKLFVSINDDPVQSYLDYLSKVNKKKPKRQPITARSATEATRVAKQAGIKNKLVLPVSNQIKQESNIPVDSVSSTSFGRLMGPLPDLNELYKSNS